MYYDTQITSVNTVNPSHLQIYMDSGLPPAAAVAVLNKYLGAKTVFIHFFTTSFPRLHVRVTHTKELTL